MILKILNKPWIPWGCVTLIKIKLWHYYNLNWGNATSRNLRLKETFLRLNFFYRILSWRLLFTFFDSWLLSWCSKSSFMVYLSVPFFWLFLPSTAGSNLIGQDNTGQSAFSMVWSTLKNEHKTKETEAVQKLFFRLKGQYEF